MAYLKELLVVMCLLAYSMADGKMKMTANHNQIEALGTMDLSLKCTYEDKNNPVVSLQIRKVIKEGYTFEELVALRRNSKMTVLDPSPDVIYSGKIIEGKGAYLSAKWKMVRKGLGGIYECLVYVVNKDGIPEKSTSVVKVEEEKTTFDDAVEAIRKLWKHMKIVRNELQTSESNCRQEIQRSEERFRKEIQMFVEENRKELQTSEQRFRNELQLSKEIYGKAFQAFQQRYRKELQTSEQRSHEEYEEYAQQSEHKIEFVEQIATTVSYTPKFKNAYYIIYSPHVVNVTLAEKLCTLRGGYLAELNDYNEWKFLQSYLQKDATKSFYYIAGRRNKANNVYYWPRLGKSKNVTYIKWSPGQPHDREYLGLYEKYDWLMVDLKEAYPRLSLGFVCEMPAA